MSRVRVAHPAVIEALDCLVDSGGDRKFIEPETFVMAPFGLVTQPLDPAHYGFGILWAEQFDGDTVIVVRGEDNDRDTSGWLRVEAFMGVHQEYTCSVSSPDSVLPEWHSHITGVGPRVTDRYLSIAGRVLTIAGHIAEQLNARDPEEAS